MSRVEELFQKRINSEKYQGALSRDIVNGTDNFLASFQDLQKSTRLKFGADFKDAGSDDCLGNSRTYQIRKEFFNPNCKVETVLRTKG